MLSSISGDDMIGVKVGQLAIRRKLGEGGMGAVYFAEHEVLRTPRVVKVLLPQWTQNAMVVQRFVNEARAAASIRHRNIIEVHDCGQLPDGSWYIVMDYLDGGTLTGFCASSGPLAPHVALQILAPVANGLEAAHATNIVHRDLKPDNIFLIQHENNPHHPVILDFGIAKLGEHDGGAVTRSGMIAGTPAYMAPEQMRDLRVVDRRTDVYALGLVAYQMVTGGWLPYEEGPSPCSYADVSAAVIYHRQMSRPPADPRERLASVPDRWAAAIVAAIHPDPTRRPQTARAFALMLAEATPGDAFLSPGVDIVRTYARELLDIGNLLETVRAPKPAGKPATSRYQLGDQLGAGGMAEVFRGTMIGAEGFARPVAVKRVLPGFATVPQFATMFVQEAQIAAQLIHPNIVQVLDFDRDPDGRLFLVMEFVEGRDLASVAAAGPLPFWAIIFIVSEVLAGLGHAHELPTSGTIRGVVHRDVSPHNVLLSWEGAVKVSDFGIAKAREASNVTASTMLKGKPSYMSPEQANGEELDGRSDLFAVGVILWELLTGRRLFDGTSRESIAQVLFRPIPRPSETRRDTPADLEAVVMRLLERERAARYPNALAAIEDLARCADAPRSGRVELTRLLAERFPDATSSRSSRSLLPGAPSAPERTKTAPTAADRPPAWAPTPTTLGSAASQSVIGGSKPRRWPLIAGGLAVAGATAAIVFVIASPRADDRPGPPATATTPVADAAAPDAAALAEIRITTNPPAPIVVDGQPRGTSPVTVQARRGASVLVEVDHDGFLPIKQPFAADAPTREILLTLAPRPEVAPVDAGVADAPPAMAKVPDTPRPPKQVPPKDKPPARGSATYNPNDVGGD